MSAYQTPQHARLQRRGSQFFINVNDGSGLDRTCTVFGDVFRGMEVVDKIVPPTETTATILCNRL